MQVFYEFFFTENVNVDVIHFQIDRNNLGLRHWCEQGDNLVSILYNFFFFITYALTEVS